MSDDSNKSEGATPLLAQNWKLTVAYDGTDFSGWQVQSGLPTIQGELQAALGRILGKSPLPQGSGRTDAGVHALGQVASFALSADIPADNLHRALNRTLPDSIRIIRAEPAKPQFHARHSAIAKTYEYRVFCGAICPPELARYVLPCRWPLDFDALQAAAAHFLGQHDFTSFAATGDEDDDPADTARRIAEASARPVPRAGFDISRSPQSMVRHVYSSSWERRATSAGELLAYRVRGNGFLHHMVRNLVGTMIDVGRGRTPANQIPAILAARDRAAAGPTAQARGLFLHSVEYPPELA